MARNSGTWTSVSASPFRRKLWFARLRASGKFRNRCTGEKGKCKNLTKTSADIVNASNWANIGPRNGKKKFGELIKKGKENKEKGLFSNTSEASKAQMAITQNVRKRKKEAQEEGGKLRGARISANKTDVRVTADGRESKTRLTAAANTARKSRLSKGRRQGVKQDSEKFEATNKKLRLRATLTPNAGIGRAGAKKAKVVSAAKRRRAEQERVTTPRKSSKR